MAKGINKVILIGNLGADPETRYSASGTAITNVRLATSERWRDKQSGDMQERTEWHRVVFFARRAEIAGEYLRKGSKVYIEGQLRTRKWQGQDGQDRYTTEIVANEMQMLDSRGGGGQGDSFGGSAPFGGAQSQQPQQRSQPQRAPQPEQQYQPPQSQPAGDSGFDDDLDDDIPF